MLCDPNLVFIHSLSTFFNKGQTKALEPVVLGSQKILGCSSKTCNEAVRGDVGLETLKSHRYKAKLK